MTGSALLVLGGSGSKEIEGAGGPLLVLGEPPTCPPDSGAGPPVLALGDPEQEMISLLEVANAALASSPRFVGSLVSAFVREGRRFLETPEGQATAQQVVGSATFANAAAIWDRLLVNQPDDASFAMTPSEVLEPLLASPWAESLDHLWAKMQKASRG